MMTKGYLNVRLSCLATLKWVALDLVIDEVSNLFMWGMSCGHVKDSNGGPPFNTSGMGACFQQINKQ